MLNPTVFGYVLRALALVFFAAGSLHVFLGLQADVSLGAGVSAQTLVDPGLDSQNRFYGACFTVFGALFILVASDLPRYVPVLRIMLWVFLVAGLVRFISVVLYGWPPPLILGLFMLEIVITPPLILWLAKLPLAYPSGGKA